MNLLQWQEQFGQGTQGAPIHIGSVTNSLKGHFTIPQGLLYATFRVYAQVLTVGSITVKLRFGFLDQDANAATQGIDFDPLAVANASDTRTPAWYNGAVAPDFNGSAFGILPPRCAVYIDTDGGVGFTGMYRVYCTGVMAD